MALTIPIDLAAIYTALGWRLVDEGCCDQARVVPPASTALAAAFARALARRDGVR
jgi:hypothetical protein